MSKKDLTTSAQPVDKLFNEIKKIVKKARSKAYKAINFNMVQAYWNIGKSIVEEEQHGEERAVYGKELIKMLSISLTKEYGRGFTETNLRYMRLFYQNFPIHHSLRDELSWTHYRLLLRLDNENQRSFYMLETIDNNWSTRELERQINSLMYERVAMSQNKEKIKELSSDGLVVRKPKDLIKDPYILEFLDLKDPKAFRESELEDALINKLQDFLLELGKGFSFIGRQKRITADGVHYYIDLVFYNYILKCFFLIDLKVGPLTHQNLGQMDFYVNYFEKEIKQENDNPTIGLILCSDKSEAIVKYTSIDKSKVFASKYKLYLPTEEELQTELDRERERVEIELKLKERDGN